MARCRDMDDKIKRLGALSGKFVAEIVASGLTWQEGIAALGVTAQIVAIQASKEGAGAQDKCVAVARTQLEQGMSKAGAIVKHSLKG